MNNITKQTSVSTHLFKTTAAFLGKQTNWITDAYCDNFM